MEFKDLNKDIVVFRYHVSPNFGMEGDDGGFSLELRGNGNLKFAAYRLFDEIKTMKIFKLNREETKEIFDILKETEKIWGKIPESLDNHLNDREISMSLSSWVRRKFRRAISGRHGFRGRRSGEENTISGSKT